MTKFSMKSIESRMQAVKSGSHVSKGRKGAGPQGGVSKGFKATAVKKTGPTPASAVVIAQKVKNEEDAAALKKQILTFVSGRQKKSAATPTDVSIRPLTNSKGKFRNMVRIEVKGRTPEDTAAVQDFASGMADAFQKKAIGTSTVVLKVKTGEEEDESAKAADPPAPGTPKAADAKSPKADAASPTPRPSKKQRTDTPGSAKPASTASPKAALDAASPAKPSEGGEKEATPVKAAKAAAKEAAPAVAAEVKLTKFFIGNLPRDKSPLETETLLRGSFLKNGLKFSSVRLLKNEFGVLNGCAVVLFCKAKQEPVAERLIAEGRVKVAGRPLRMEKKLTAKETQDGAGTGLMGERDVVFAANLPLNLTEGQVREVFTKWGDVTEVSMNMTDAGTFNGTARVRYANTQSVARAVHHSGTLLVNRRPIRVDFNKRKGARSAQLDLTPSQLRSHTVLVYPNDPTRMLIAPSVKTLFSTIGRVRYCRRASPDDDKDDPPPPGAVTVCFTLSACVGIALQFAGKEADSVPLSMKQAEGEAKGSPAKGSPEGTPSKKRKRGEGEEGKKKEKKEGAIGKAPCEVLVRILEGLDTARSRPEVSFTFGGVRSWSKKEWSTQRRLDELQAWNQKGENRY